MLFLLCVTVSLCLQDTLLALAKAVANCTAQLVLNAKNVAGSCEDPADQNRVISSATQCALSTSELVACAKVSCCFLLGKILSVNCVAETNIRRLVLCVLFSRVRCNSLWKVAVFLKRKYVCLFSSLLFMMIFACTSGVVIDMCILFSRWWHQLSTAQHVRSNLWSPQNMLLSQLKELSQLQRFVYLLIPFKKLKVEIYSAYHILSCHYVAIKMSVVQVEWSEMKGMCTHSSRHKNLLTLFWIRSYWRPSQF